MSAKHLKKRHKKYKTISFKLSVGQYKSLSNYCKARHTTPIKLIKKTMDRFFTSYRNEVPEKFYVSERQLDIWDKDSEMNQQ